MSKESVDRNEEFLRELSGLEYLYFPDIQSDAARSAQRDYLEALKLLSSPDRSSEENIEYLSESKRSIWIDNKNCKTVIIILSYIAGCGFCSALFGEFSALPYLLLEILGIALGGAVLGFVVGAIVVTIFHTYATSSKMKLLRKVLVFLLVPIAFVIFLKQH